MIKRFFGAAVISAALIGTPAHAALKVLATSADWGSLATASRCPSLCPADF